jgi:hypothetical protein
MIGMTAAGIALGLALTGNTPAWAVGGSFHCERAAISEVSDHVEGSFALLQIVTQYLGRWDAQEAKKQCRAYAEGKPYDISCLNDRRDWDAIISNVPEEYFGRSNPSLAKTVRDEIRAGNGFKEAMDYCRSVGAIK